MYKSTVESGVSHADLAQAISALIEHPSELPDRGIPLATHPRLDDNSLPGLQAAHLLGSATLSDLLEQERIEIAREIHDEIGGTIAAARIDLDWLARHSPAGSAALQRSQSALELISHVVTSIQRVVTRLRPPQLDMGLSQALQWLCTDFERRCGVPVVTACDGPIDSLGEDVQVAVYRILQESLTNIGKYSQATQVCVQCSAGDHTLVIEIIDNGQGFVQSVRRGPHQHGLVGMQERARMVHGHLEISTGDDGTMVRLTVPVDT